MTILFYQRQSNMLPHERAAVRALEKQYGGARVRYRNAQAFRPLDVEEADLVVTDSDRVRRAYEGAGTEVRGVEEDVARSAPEAAEKAVPRPVTDNGWYAVVDAATGEPFHEGKLRKADAESMAREINEG